MIRNLLMIEDDQTDIMLYQHKLRRALGHVVVIDIASSVAEARLLLQSKIFEVVLLDLNLKDSVGVETVQKIRPHCEETPLIILSGMRQKQTVMEAIYAGADDYLTKGADDSKITQELLGYWVNHYKHGHENTATSGRQC